MEPAAGELGLQTGNTFAKTPGLETSMPEGSTSLPIQILIKIIITVMLIVDTYNAAPYCPLSALHVRCEAHLLGGYHSIPHQFPVGGA